MTLLLSLLAIVPTVTLVPIDEVMLSGREVRLGDVVRVERSGGLPQSSKSTVIARLPDNASTVRLSRTQVAGLVRRALPGVDVMGESEGLIALNAPSSPADADRASSCLRILIDRAAGSVVTAEHVDSAPCADGSREGALRYDASTGANVAVEQLQAGDLIDHVRLAATPVVAKAQRLTLKSKVGPVMIERPVTALQAARTGDRYLFVRTDDGEILAAPIQGTGTHE